MTSQHNDEYHDAMVTMLELIWGEGLMSPGGTGNIKKMLSGLNLQNKQLLDIGSGLGGHATYLAETSCAQVTGIDLEEHLVNKARNRAQQLNLSDKVSFITVDSGELPFPEDQFDIVYSAGAFTQVDDKLSLFRDCYRVLKPGGFLASYDWMKNEGEYSDDMLYWFKMEGLTYAMQTLEDHGALLEQAGFTEIQLEDCSEWYRKEAALEYHKMQNDLFEEMCTLMGKEQAQYFIENWRAMLVVCEKGEMRQAYYRGRKPCD